MLFSIITPVYQVEKYIHKCINSVLEQTYTDFEFILVDDGSKDKCPTIIDEYCSKDKRIKAIHKSNGGVVSARKAGVAIASGEYVVILDSDDWIEHDFLEKMERKIKETEADIVCCGYYCSYGNGNRKEIKLQYNVEWNIDEIQSFCKERLFDFPQTLWAKAMRKSIYSSYQMKVKDIITMGDDGVVIYSMLPKCTCISFICDPLYNYRIVESSMTHNKRKVYSVEAVVDRVKLLSDNLSSVTGVNAQIATYATHAYFNCCLSFFRNYRFNQAKRQLESSYAYLSKNNYFHISLVGASKLEIIAQFLLKYRLFFIIKLISYLRSK